SGILEPAAAAKLAVARRAKPSAVPGHVRLVLTLELRRELAEKLSERAIREERNIEAIIIALLEAAAKRWRLPMSRFALASESLSPQMICRMSPRLSRMPDPAWAISNEVRDA